MPGALLRAIMRGKSVSSGDTEVLLDSSGNQFVRPSQLNSVVGQITANSQTISAAVNGYPSALFSINGTYSGLLLVFEVSDDGGTTWYQTTASRVGGTSNNGAADFSAIAPGTNATMSWAVPTLAATNARLRVTGFASGAANIRITPLALSMWQPTINLSGKQGGAVDTQSNTSDGAGGVNGLATYSSQYVFNGNTSDRVRGQEKVTVLSSAARTATTSANLTLYNNCALLIVVDVTARASTTTLTPSLVMGQSGFVANATIWTAAAAINSSSGTFMYALWPFPSIASPVGYTEVKNVPLFRELQVTITHSDANSVTYSVTAYTAAV